jgi:signal transduction histidine kinase
MACTNERYQLLRFNSASKLALIYISLAIIALAIYFGLDSVLRTLLNLNAPLQTPLGVGLYALIVVLVTLAGGKWLESRLEAGSPAKQQSYQQVLQDYPSRLVTVPLEVDGILNLFLEQVNSTIAPNTASVYLLSVQDSLYQIRAGQMVATNHSEFLASDSLPTWLLAEKEALCFDKQGQPIGSISLTTDELERLQSLNTQALIPMLGTNSLLGWLLLGAKADNRTYKPTDLSFLTSLANQTVIALENAQLIETANRKTNELLALQETSLDIASEQGTGRVLTSVLERATKLLAAKGGTIFMLDAEHALLNSEICYNLGADYASLSLPLGQGIAGEVVASGEAKIFNAYYPNGDAITPQMVRDFGPTIAVPLAWKEQVRGVLELIRPQNAAPFTQDDLNLLTLLASQATIAVENARLLKEANYRATQLTTLNEVNRLISATLDRDRALNLVLEMAVEILDTEAGSIFLVDNTRRSLIFEIALGPAGVTLIGAKIPINTKSIAGAVAYNREALIVNNVNADPRWNTSFDEASDFQTRDILGVPMLAFDRVVGVIEVINKKNGEGFDENDLSTLSIFSSQAAIAIVNAQRFTQTDQALASRVQELNTLQMIDRELNAVLDFQTVLELTISRTMDAVGASVGLLAVVNDEATGLYFRAMMGVAREYEKYREEMWPIEKGIIGQVARTGHPLVVQGQQMDVFASDGRSTYQLCAPIMLNERIMGVISLEISDPEEFTEKDAEFTARLARHASLALRNAQLFEEVKAANQAKTEFMSVASHELKIPMTSIKGYARMMEMVGGSTMSDQQKEFLRIISSNVDRMSRLVSDLLDVSRIESGRIKLEVGQVYIREVVDEVLQSLHTQIEEKNLSVQIDIPKTLPPIWADYGRLVQVLTNLISNAYKYTLPDGNIYVIADTVNGTGQKELSVRVKDTGLGISEEDQKQLFKKFFRASDQNVRDVPGTGLGLSITKSMIEMHGGQMWFESQVGEGSTFGFNIPLDNKPTEVMRS